MRPPERPARPGALGSKHARRFDAGGCEKFSDRRRMPGSPAALRHRLAERRMFHLALPGNERLDSAKGAERRLRGRHPWWISAPEQATCPTLHLSKGAAHSEPASP